MKKLSEVEKNALIAMLISKNLPSLQPHPANLLTGQIQKTEEEIMSLWISLLNFGCRQPIILIPGEEEGALPTIWDGNIRYGILSSNSEDLPEDFKYNFFVMDTLPDDPEFDIIDMNLHYKHLDQSDRAAIAAGDLMPRIMEDIKVSRYDKTAKQGKQQRASQIAADMVGAKRASVDNAFAGIKITPKVKDWIHSKQMTANSAKTFADIVHTAAETGEYEELLLILDRLDSGKTFTAARQEFKNMKKAEKDILEFESAEAEDFGQTLAEAADELGARDSEPTYNGLPNIEEYYPGTMTTECTKEDVKKAQPLLIVRHKLRHETIERLAYTMATDGYCTSTTFMKIGNCYYKIDPYDVTFSYEKINDENFVTQQH